MNHPSPLPLPLESYYESPKRAYWVTDQGKDWMMVDKEAVRLRLNKLGYSSRRGDGLIAPADDVILRIQDEKNVLYVGALAGYWRGLHEICGNKVLVTCSPQLVEPKPGDWKVLRQVIEQQLKSAKIDQTPYFYGWLKLSESALRKGQITYAPALTLAGKKGCGKSLLQEIISVVLGKRSAKPYRYMAGKSEFNHDLFKAEHQIIADEQPFTDHRSRNLFGAAIKQITATTERSCHGKGRDAISLKTFMRLTISLNDELHNLMMLPPLNEDSLQDKFILLHCHHHPMPMPAGTPDEKELFWAQLVSELPAFVHWLQNEFVIPEFAVDRERHGVKPYLHPGLMARLDSIAPETKLLSLVDLVIFTGNTAPDWKGTAEELSNKLYTSDYAYEAKQLLKSDQGCGQLLGALATICSKRVENARTGDARQWHILRSTDVVDQATLDAIADVSDFIPFPKAV